MKRLKRIGQKLDDIVAVNAIVDEGLDNDSKTVLFENDGVKLKVTGTLICEIELDADHINVNSIDTNEILDILKSRTNFISELSDYYLAHNPEYQLPTTTKVNAWYDPKPLTLNLFDVNNFDVDRNQLVVTCNIELQNEITKYSDLGVENEEFDIYGVDKDTFKFSKDIMTREYYR